MITEIEGNIVDVIDRKIFPGKVLFGKNKILEIRRTRRKLQDFILPGFVDSHIHIESSMLSPQHFSRIAVSHGTVAVVSDPHEIANVLGLQGIRYMIKDSSRAAIKFFFGAPSCVPAASVESSGAMIDLSDIDYLFREVKLKYLSEMMNYPGVIGGDKHVLEKLKLARKYGKKIDGHAPGLRGEELTAYISEGIDTDHECFSYDEAVEKIHKGMMIQIREGSAAKNFNALEKLISLYPEKLLFCSDDLHPDDLMKGHINILVRNGIKKNHDLFDLLRIATYNPVMHYGLEVGMLREGDPADFIVIQDLKKFIVKETYINGKLVYQKGRSLRKIGTRERPNHFNAQKINPENILIPDRGTKIKVIDVVDAELITGALITSLTGKDGYLYSDVHSDILKIVVVNRYQKSSPAIAFIRNFGLKKGAIAGSIAHDNHNIIAVGVEDESICKCVNWIIDKKGGIAAATGDIINGIPLPIGGIISDKPVEWLAEKYEKLNSMVREMGCKLSAPFMTLSFMSLIVIPHLKLSSKGLFDVNSFSLTSIYSGA